jgi:hypothetical protein
VRWPRFERIFLDEDDPDFARLRRSEQLDVVHAIEVFAETGGKGGTAVVWPAGAIITDVILVGRLEVDLDLYPDHPDGPTLVVTGISRAVREPMADD